MPVKLLLVRSLMPLFLLVSWAAASTVLMHAQTVSANPPSLTAAEAQELVDRALTAELRIAQDPNHPMRYRLRKSSPRLIPKWRVTAPRICAPCPINPE